MLIIPVGADCKLKQNPVSIETKYKVTSLKEWPIASQSRIFFLSVPQSTISLEKLLQKNITDTVTIPVKLPPFKNIKIKTEKSFSICPKLQSFTYTSLKCFKQNERNNLYITEILMKDKTFGKESKTPFPNFKSINNVENKKSTNR